MKTHLLTLALLSISLAGCNTKNWQEFKSSAGNFSVTMPGKPKDQTQSVATPIGNIKAYMYMVKLGSTAYIVSYSDYPPQVTSRANANSMLDGARSGSVANVQGKLLNEKVISLGKHPGRDLTIDVPRYKKELRQRIILVNNRLYQLVVEAKDVNKIAGDIDKFFSSFKLLRQ